MINARIKLLREEKGLTQRDLARLLKLSPSTIAMYETDRRMPDPDTLRKIADFFDVSVDYLLGRTDMRNLQDYEIIKSLAGDDPELLEILKKFAKREDLKVILKQLLNVDKSDLKPLARMISGLASEDKEIELIIKPSEEEAKKHVEELSKKTNYKIINNE